MKKILHIQVLPKLSGVQNISLEIMKALPDKSFDKWIIFGDTEVCGDKNECIRQFESAGTKVIFSSKIKREIKLLSDLFACIELYRLCKKEKFDIVHTHSTKPGIIGRIAATLAGVPLVIHTVHGLSFHKFVKFPRWQFYWACEMIASLFCDKIVLVNHFYEKYFKWIKHKTITVYNGIDFSTFPTQKNQSKDPQKLQILSVGRLDTPKDPLTLLEAARLVINKYPEVHFTIVGDGEKYNECKAYINRHDLKDQIFLTGWQNNVIPYYQTHDIFALSSIYESFGLIFLEAGFFELPTVATNVEGIPEVIENGKTGLLCNPKDPKTFADHLIYLIEHPEKRIEFGRNARHRVTGLFPAEKMTTIYRQLYE